MALIPEESLKSVLLGICDQFGLKVILKEFQIKFFMKAIGGIGGFLRAPCGMGKSLCFQLLPFALKHFRFPEVNFPIVLVIQPLRAISESQVCEQKVPSCMLNEGGTFLLGQEKNKIKKFAIEDIHLLEKFSGVIYSSPEVFDGKHGMKYKLKLSGRIVAIVIDEADKINQWGEDFRDGYTRLGLLKPFMALHAAVYFFTATATAEDIKVASDLLVVQDELQMNICEYRGEYIKAINRPNSSFGWEGVFREKDGIVYEPGLRQLLLDEYLSDFFKDPESYPRTIMLFRDQTHLGNTADIIGQKLGYQSPEKSSWIQFHSLVDPLTLQEIYKRFNNPTSCYRLILMTTKGLCGTHIVDVERCIMIRPMSSPHDLMQLMGRGGRGPNLHESALEVIWNNSDLSTNVPGMTADVRWVLGKEGCIPEKLCKIFGYKFVRNSLKCCSNCDRKTAV